jgi:hypothetical protein
VIVAAGFVLFALPSVNANYWTTFFPAFVVLGLGMAASVAPLTTVVMNSVERDRAGTASGINNAVARVAGVLAIAILGVVMLKAFTIRLEHSMVNLNLPAGTAQQIQSNLAKLGALKVPANLGSKTSAALQAAIAGAFVFGFRVIMMVCATLALASAGVAWRMIPSAGKKT